MKSIQTKILFVIISAMLVMGVSISIISISYISSILNDDSDMITQSVADAEALKINGELDQIETTVKIMENYVIATLDLQSLSDAEYEECYLAQAKTAFYDVVENSTEAKAFYLRFAPELTDGVSGFFVSCSVGGSHFFDYTVTDLTDWETMPRESVCWYSEPKAFGGPVWLHPYNNPTSKMNVISYVIPIYIDRVFVGVVGIDIDFATITAIIDDVSVYNNGFAYLASDTGEIFYSAADEHTLNRAHTDHGFAEERRTIDNNMTIVIHADYSDIQSDAYRVMIFIIFILVLVMAGFVYITYLLTRKIVRPLKQLTLAAESLTDGNTELNLDSCNTGDEVELLANSMKRTSEKLHGYMSYINALAYRDSLTGVKNRTAYSEAAANIDVRIRTNGNVSFGVLVADINMLKRANDQHGHEIGNRLITTVAKIICDVFKHSPVFRLGGDEFAVIMENDDLENCESLIELMDEKCAEKFISVPNGKIPVSVARGFEIYNSEIDEYFESVFSRADKKMYEHKKITRQ